MLQKALEKEIIKSLYNFKSSGEKQDKKGLFELARLYDYVYWVRQNLSEAIKYYKKSCFRTCWGKI